MMEFSKIVNPINVESAVCPPKHSSLEQLTSPFIAMEKSPVLDVSTNREVVRHARGIPSESTIC